MGQGKSNGSAERSSETFRVNLFVHEDGTFAVTGENLGGLVLETESIKEMRKELLRLTPHLLRTNHGLSEEEINNVRIHISMCRMVNGKQKLFQQLPKRAPHLMWEGTLPTIAIA